jgi:tetratricopeptide (TPR) repeat protein
LAPKDPEVLSKYGAFLHSQEDFDKARSALYECISLAPDHDSRNYMLLAELVQGKQSIECYTKGIELLEKKLLSIFNDGDEVRKDLALAYSAMSEVYQSDLLHEQESEKKCYAMIMKVEFIKSGSGIRSAVSGRVCAVRELFYEQRGTEERHSDVEEDCGRSEGADRGRHAF